MRTRNAGPLKWRVALIAGAVMCGLAACSENPLNPTATVVQIRMLHDTVRLSAIGRVQQLSAIARDASGRVVDPPLLSWQSSDSSVVRVDQSGTVTAVRNGSAEVSVLVGGAVRATSAVRVSAGVMETARISAVLNPMGNAATVSDSVGLTIHAATAAPAP